MSLFGAANVVGAIVVFLYLNIVAGDDHHTGLEQLTWGPYLLAAYGVVFAVVALAVAMRELVCLDWWYEGRRPSEEERRGTLLIPTKLVALSALAWVGGNLVFIVAGVINGNPSQDIIRAAIGTALGGATTCAACFMLTERAMRPIFADALRDSVVPTRTLGVRRRIALAWALGSGIPLVSIASSPLRAEEESLADVALLAAIGAVGGGMLVGVATRSVSDRIVSVREALSRISAGDLTVEVPVDEPGEIGTLQAGVNDMVRGLRERQVIADLFGRHVGNEVARRALEDGVHLGGEQRDVSILFVDVAGSVALAASRPPNEVVALLNELFTIVVRVVGDEGGWVDKFEGDAALCVFGAPAPLAEHPTHALRAAQQIIHEVRRTDVEVGVGVSSGIVVAGNVGSEARFEYTVIGDPVNEAARLTEAAKARPSRVLAAARTVERASADVTRCWTPAETLPLRGRPEPTPTYEPIA